MGMAQEHALPREIKAYVKAGDFLGRTALGLAVFSLGMFIYDNLSWEIVRRGVSLTLFRVLALPAVTFLVLLFFSGLSADLRMFLFLQSGIPSAISLAVFSPRYGYKTAEISGLVIVTSLFSFVTLNGLALLERLFW